MGSRAVGLAAVLTLAATLSGSAAAAPPWALELALIKRGLDRAQARGRLTAAEADAYRGTVSRAASELPRLPGSRYRNLAGVVHEVAGLWKGYDEPRGRTLFGMLDFNVGWFSSHWDRKPGTDVVDSDGTWYRAFPGLGFQFHPLENFGKLDNFVTQQNDSRAAQLAEALLARAVVRNGGLAWEYYFRFEGGQPPWISGMAQAVAAQALARAGTQLGDPSLTAAARRVYTTVPSLTRRVATGPWIRLYAFNDETVLNAQLQTILSLQDYAAQTGDRTAVGLASKLQSAADGLLPQFDTGYWSLYSLGGPEATLDYHQYVVRLLSSLSKQTQDPTLATYAQRFGADLTEAPLVKAGAAPAPIYPWPADGYRDSALYSFWISKRSTVRLVIAHAGPPLVVSRGWHALAWSPGRIDPGSYAPRLDAVDLAGNASETVLPPVAVRVDTQPPSVTASLAGRRLYWRGSDDASPWLVLRIVLRRSSTVRTLSLGPKPFRGSALLRAPRGAWQTTLYASDSSGNTTGVALGLLPGAANLSWMAAIEALVEEVERSYAEAQERMNDPSIYSDHREAAEVGRRLKEFETASRLARKWREVSSDLDAARADGDLRELVPELEERALKLEQELKLALVEADPADRKDVIVEIRQAAGGDEAALWAGDLVRMLTRYAERRGLTFEQLESSPNDTGGFQSISFAIKGDGAYSIFKWEGGTHRVQRVPVTESQGRIHTSTATVAVMPEAEALDVELHDNDLKIDVYRSTGPGGQSVNTTDSAVRITHLPTGLVVAMQDEKSQLQNKTKALRVLRARLYELERERRAAEQAATRRSQIGSGERAEKIRTYNYPENRVTDHRVKLTVHNLDRVLEGELDEFTEALAAEERRRALEAAAV